MTSAPRSSARPRPTAVCAVESPDDGKVRARGELGRREQPLGEKLRRDDAPARTARAQAGVGEDGDDGRLVGREAVREVERDRRERRVPQPCRPHGERVGRWDDERGADGLGRQRAGGVPRAARAAGEGGYGGADEGEATQHRGQSASAAADAASVPSALKTRSRAVPPSVISASYVVWPPETIRAASFTVFPA